MQTAYPPSVTFIAGEPAQQQPLTILKMLLTAVAVVSFSNFNPLLFGVADLGTSQQAVAVLLWSVIIALSFYVRSPERPLRTGGLYVFGLFLALSVLSPFWSAEPQDGLSKAVALALCTFAAWRIFNVLPIRTIFSCIMSALTLIAAVSILLVFAAPSLAVSNSWQHPGLWTGVFDVKQALGTSCAFLVFVGICFLFDRPNVASATAVAVGLACVVGSGSRGGGIIAALSFGCILMGRQSASLTKLMAVIPILCFLIATAAIVFMAQSGLSYIPVFGYELDFTERTVIWQHALSYWLDKPLLGYGLNGFWTIEDIYLDFLKQRGWVLDNYHSGYVAILTELGLVGYAFAAVLTLMIAGALGLGAARARVLGREERFGYELAFGIVVLSFVINLTEAVFLRSTNFPQIMFDFGLFQLFTRTPVVAVGSAPSLQNETISSTNIE